ncbi:MAG TPA: PKD domain-containing protein [Chitinophagaceae bacterium]|nr:PKD domain-containing protein [Chitinophagaceae bacterium]
MRLLIACIPALRKYSLACLLLLATTSLQAQVQANFSPDKSGGCSPLTVKFTNTSSGISADATYLWDFGNGNTSTLKDPSAIFIDEKAYTVTLTVTQNGQSSTRTMNVEVYKKPTADFTANAVKGCLPFNVGFTAQAQAGSGSIASYHWDFGDGFTGQQFSAATNHIYNTKQPATVSLTVKNNYGCHTTVVKPNYIEVLPSLTADFDASQQVLCQVTDPVQFTNRSKGPGTLSYVWDFGDGNTSTQTNPSHSFNQKGNYTVKLTANSSEGCTATKIKTDYLNVANYTTDLQVPATICRNGYVTFSAICSPFPNRVEWEIDGVPHYSSGTNLYTTFNTAGAHTIKATATYGTCKQSVTKNFTVHELPSTSGFEVDVKGVCGSPVMVQFKDTTSNAVRWEWNFDYWWNSSVVHATTQQASHTYINDNSYNVSLQTFTAAGCSTRVFKPVSIQRPTVGIVRTGPDPWGSFIDCKPATLGFKVNTTENIVSYRWIVNNSVVSTQPTLSYTFSAIGSYSVRLEWETDKGCKGTSSFMSSIQIGSLAQADFTSISGTTICGNTPVTFQASGTGFSEGYWYVNGNFAGYGSNRLVYQFPDSGKYTIQFVAGQINGCRDTVTKVDYITVLPPFPKINTIKNNCDVRERVDFTQSSRYAESLKWDFGDGNVQTINSNQPTISHTYPGTGKYKVVLTAINGQCSVKDSAYAYVFSKPSPLLTASPTQVCPDFTLSFTLSNLPPTPSENVSTHYYFERIEYGDGTLFTGNNNSWWGHVNPLPYNGQLYNFEPGKTGLRMIVRETYFGCLDTTNYIPLVVNGTKAGFRILNNNVCFKDSVRFEDTSKATPGNAIIQWEWDFGDGQRLTLNRGGTVSHLYANPGNYYVTLRVRDAAGCITSSSQWSTYVRVNGPKAAFSANSTVPFNSLVYFNNFTNDFSNYRATYHWDFGDGGTSTVHTPQHTFTTPGKYTVKLTATDPVTGCSSVATQEITVQLVNAYFNFSTSAIGQSNCIPLLTNFAVTAFNVDSLSWDFGDGTTAGDLRYASHVYDKPGKYIVTLTARGANGIIYRYLDSVIIRQPTVTVTADDWDGCPGHTVNLSLTSTYARNYVWDFGDGTTAQSQAGTISHTYLKAGVYTPALLVTDSAGCTTSAKVNNKVTIHPNPHITIAPADGSACLGQPVTLTASGAQTYSWSPATGLDNPLSAQPVATPTQTTTYRIDGVDARGCSSHTEYTLTVRQPFKVQLQSQVEICEGKSTVLQASGAHQYKWINTTTGLSNTQVADPIASPSVTTEYTVVGYDAYGCFTDTASVLVTVNPMPTVSAGNDVDAQPAEPVQLSATGSSNVVRWLWTPATYLNCTNCPAPVSKPMVQITYKVTGITAKGCEASDEVLVKMQCNESRIRIPNAFSPNKDGHNERFEVKGISVIRHMTIYNRWGNKVFERSNFIASDESACWDGTFNGAPQPVGTYVYIMQAQCPGGEVFVKKGTVTLVR